MNDFSVLGLFLLSVLWYPMAYAVGLIVVIVGLMELPARVSSYWLWRASNVNRVINPKK